MHKRKLAEMHRHIDRAYRDRRIDTALRAHVLHQLVNMIFYFRRACPSHQTLAERARCSIATVQRALTAARKHGLITWEQRYEIIDGRPHQTTSVYSFAYDGQDERVTPECLNNTPRYKEQWRPKRTIAQGLSAVSDAWRALEERLSGITRPNTA